MSAATKHSHEDSAAACFAADTKTHELTIVHDDGLYRHVRVQRPETWSYGFSLVTWPGHLAITGDMGAYLFARTTDMFEFFESDEGRINPYYWSEKLQAPHGRRSVREWSETAFRRVVDEWYASRIDEKWGEVTPDDVDDEGRTLRAALDADVLDDSDSLYVDEHVAHERLRDFEWGDLRISESWEYDLTDYEHQFLWCCHAIVLGIRLYREEAPDGR